MDKRRYVRFFATELPIHLAAQVADQDFPALRQTRDLEALARAKFHTLTSCFVIPRIAYVRASFLYRFTTTYQEHSDALFCHARAPIPQDSPHAPYLKEA